MEIGGNFYHIAAWVCTVAAQSHQAAIETLKVLLAFVHVVGQEHPSEIRLPNFGDSLLGRSKSSHDARMAAAELLDTIRYHKSALAAYLPP